MVSSHWTNFHFSNLNTLGIKYGTTKAIWHQITPRLDECRWLVFKHVIAPPIQFCQAVTPRLLGTCRSSQAQGNKQLSTASHLFATDSDPFVCDNFYHLRQLKRYSHRELSLQ